MKIANVKFSRKEFEKHIKLSSDVQEKIPYLGTPLENLNDNEIELEIFPNRPDLLSFQGYIRALKAFLGKEKGLRNYKINPPQKDFEVVIDKNLEKIRPFTACAIVKGIKFDNEKIKEIVDVQEKIHTTFGRNRKKIAIGIYPLEKIKLPIKFLAMKPEEIKFIPLEETKEMTAPQILTKTSTGRDYAHLLRGYDKYPVFVDSAGKILSMPPIINSQNTGKITENTRDVFIECSGFNLDSLKKTLNIIVTMMADMGGSIYQMNLQYKQPEKTPDLTPEKVKINIKDAEKLLGIELNEKKVKESLDKMGYDYKNSIVQIPAWRVDILHPVDIYEDIAIGYGFEKFQPEIPEIATIGQEDPKEIMKRKISDILTGLGLIEISTYHLTKKEDQFKKMVQKAQDIIEVESSKTDYNILRQNLLHLALKVLSENVDAEYPQKIFEIGKVFSLDQKQETGIIEKNKISIALIPSNFTEIKRILDYLGNMLDTKFEVQETENQSFITGRTGSIIFNGKTIGIMGEISPTVLKNSHLKMPVAALEMGLDEIF
ncbi:MAG: phenylalanine--tRNA ligase subunit beta [archaeon]